MQQAAHCIVSLLVGILLASAALAAPPTQDPAALDLHIPVARGPAIPGDGRRVQVPIDGSRPEVCNLLCEVGGRSVAIRPNGALVSVASHEAILTDRPFKSISREELAGSLTAEQFKNFKSAYTKRFVYIYNTSDKFYVGTSRILETMYPAVLAYWERLGIEVHDPDTPLLILMFRTYAEYNQFSTIPEGVVAYYSIIPNYVAMYEESPQTSLNPLFFQKEAIATVAHEGTHQILSNIGVNARRAVWPGWIREGLAEYFGSTELGANVRWKGVGTVSDSRMGELEFYVKDNSSSVAAGDTIRNTVRKLDFTSTDYAISWAMVHFLAQKRQPAFYAYLKEVSQIQPFQSLSSDQSEALFVKHFGDNYPAIEQALIKHLTTLPYTNPFVRTKPSRSKSSKK
jgi:hypothetical protein